MSSIIEGYSCDIFISYRQNDNKYDGWGLYKQGKYEEVLQILEKSRDLSPIYDHNIFLHLQEVKKAVASQKKN